MLVHIPADGSAASFVSFPRDMYVQIPGHGGASSTPPTAPLRRRGRQRRRQARRRRPAAHPDHQQPVGSADRPLRRDQPARVHQPDLDRRGRRRRPVPGQRRLDDRGALRRRPADPDRQPGAAVRPAAARGGGAVLGLRPRRPPAGLHRRDAAQPAVLGPDAQPRTSSARSSSRSAARSPSTAAWTSSPWPPRCRACSRAASPSRPSPASPTPTSTASRCSSCRPRRCSPTSSPT